jgi:hypothetical protein
LLRFVNFDHGKTSLASSFDRNSIASSVSSEKR